MGVFFHKQVFSQTHISIVFDGLIILTCLVIVLLRAKNKESLIKVNTNIMFMLVIAGLLAYIFLTTRSHRKQVDALGKLLSQTESRLKK
jgi:uncharacterized membrane protein YkvI